MNLLWPAPRRLVVAGTAALALLAAGCSNDVALRIAPDPGLVVSLRNDIQPIFTLKCASLGCHGDFPSENLDLGDGSAWGSLVNVPSNQSPLDRVEPGDSANSYIVHKLEGTQASAAGSGDQMPFGGPFLPKAEIDLIRSWIDQGAADN